MRFKNYKALKRFSVSAVKVVAIVFFGVATYRIATCHPNIDFSKFDFSDLLALIMSLFAIGLSVAFYFKSTDTSNQFYDNTYKFTEDTAKILGRIEAGFGERLRHMDEGYSQLSGRIDRLKVAEESQEEEIEEQKQVVQSKDEEYKKVIDELLQKSKIDATEKEKLRKQLEMAEQEKIEAQKHLESLNAEIGLIRELKSKFDERARWDDENRIRVEYHSSIRKIVKSPIIRKILSRVESSNPKELCSELGNRISMEYPEEAGFFRKIGLMDGTTLTRKGCQTLYEAFESYN